MNTIKKRQENRKKSLVMTSTSTRNALKASRPPAEKLHHRNQKYLLWTYALEHHIDCSTEVVFRGGGRADVVYNDWAVAFEVLHSEELKDFKKKRYPLPTIPIPSLLPPGELWIMLTDLDATSGETWKYYNDKILKCIEQGMYRAEEPSSLGDLLFKGGP